jgi:hypothetical protein
VITVNIPPEAKKGEVFFVDICKSTIKNNSDTLYYSILDTYYNDRVGFFTAFTVNTSRCVDTILIDNACPKPICEKAIFTFTLSDGSVPITGTTYGFTYEKEECEYATDDEEDIIDGILTLTKVVKPSIIKIDLRLNTGNDYLLNPYKIDLSKGCEQTFSFTSNEFEE